MAPEVTFLDKFVSFHMPGLSSGTFSDKPIGYPHKLIHNTLRGEVQSFMRQIEGMNILSVSQMSSVDWQQKELPVGLKPMAMKGQIRVFGSSAPIHDAIGLG